MKNRVRLLIILVKIECSNPRMEVTNTSSSEYANWSLVLEKNENTTLTPILDKIFTIHTVLVFSYRNSPSSMPKFWHLSLPRESIRPVDSWHKRIRWCNKIQHFYNLENMISEDFGESHLELGWHELSGGYFWMESFYDFSSLKWTIFRLLTAWRQSWAFCNMTTEAIVISTSAFSQFW